MTSRVQTRPITPATAFGWPVVAFCGLLLTGCAGMGDTEQRVLTGAAIGAGAGAGLGLVTGGLSIPAGAVIGAGAGAATGLAVDLLKK